MEDEEIIPQASKELNTALAPKKTQEYYTVKLKEAGIIDGYEYLLRSLCKYGLPTTNVFEFAALSMLKFEKKWKLKKRKQLQERIRLREEEKEKKRKEDKLKKEQEEEAKAKERKRMAKLLEKKRKEREAEETKKLKEALDNNELPVKPNPPRYMRRNVNQDEEPKGARKPEGRVLAPLSKVPGKKFGASKSPIKRELDPLAKMNPAASSKAGELSKKRAEDKKDTEEIKKPAAQTRIVTMRKPKDISETVRNQRTEINKPAEAKPIEEAKIDEDVVPPEEDKKEEQANTVVVKVEITSADALNARDYTENFEEVEPKQESKKEAEENLPEQKPKDEVNENVEADLLLEHEPFIKEQSNDTEPKEEAKKEDPVDQNEQEKEPPIKQETTPNDPIEDPIIAQEGIVATEVVTEEQAEQKEEPMQVVPDLDNDLDLAEALEKKANLLKDNPKSDREDAVNNEGEAENNDDSIENIDLAEGLEKKAA